MLFFHNHHFRLFSQLAMCPERRIQSMACMIVGLGNPDMPHTRHNVGLQLVEDILQTEGTRWIRQRKLQGFTAEKDFKFQSSSLKLILLKSKHPMNNNGKTVAKAAQNYNIAPNKIFVVHDDLDKPFGKISMKYGGSASGHNGVKSVIQCLKTDEFPRLRIGIGRPSSKSQVVEYVLQQFNKEEKDQLPEIIDEAANKLMSHIQSLMFDSGEATTPDTQSYHSVLKKG